MKRPKNPWTRRAERQTSLRFSPDAWAKLCFLRDLGDTEIGGFGLSSATDPLLVIDLLVVRQFCSCYTVRFEDEAVADLVDRLVDQGVAPERFTRIWIHTHPGKCPLPSGTDEATFTRVFGQSDWAVMAILARSGASYARLSFHVGPQGSLRIPVRVDYRAPFAGADWEAWEQEYALHIQPELALPGLEAFFSNDAVKTDIDSPTFSQEELFAWL